VKLKISSDERSPEPAPDMQLASANIAQSNDQRRSQSGPYREGDGIGTPYGNLVFKGPGDDGFLHVQSRTSDYRVPTHLGNDRDAIRAWAIRSVEQGDIDRSNLYPGAAQQPGSQGSQGEISRTRGEPYRAGDGVGTPYGNLVFRGLGVDGYLHVQSRTSDYRVPTHLGDDRDAIRGWAIRSVEQGHIDRAGLYPGTPSNPGNPGSSGEPARSRGEPYRPGDGIGTPYGNLVYRGVGDDGFLHVQSRTSDYRVPTHVGNDRDAVRAWAIRSVEQGDIDRNALYQPGQQPQGVQRSEIPPHQRSPYADGYVFSSQLNDRMSGDFPRDANGNATIPNDWNNNIWLRNETRIQNQETDAQLLGRFNNELQLASHYNPIANALLDHFVANTGQTFNSPPGSEWSNLVRDDGEGRRIATTVNARILDIAEQQYARTGRVDFETMRVPLNPEDRAVWGNKPQSPAFGAFGSTDGLQVEIQNGRFDPETKQISGNVRITVIDTFGLSNSDNDSPGQIAMWLLQHQRGYQPFIHTVQFDEPLSGTVRTQRPHGGGLRPTE
jgi:hypothetical protein